MISSFSLLRASLGCTIVALAIVLVTSIPHNQSSQQLHQLEFDVHRAERRYELRATTLPLLLQEYDDLKARSSGPKSFGRTDWNFTIVPAPIGGLATTCANERVAISVHLLNTLPIAVNAARFSVEDSVNWRAFLSALVRHEARHDSLVVATMSAFVRDVTPPSAGIEPVRSIADCVSTLGARLKRVNDSLDLVTNGGTSEGVVLRINIRHSYFRKPGQP